MTIFHSRFGTCFAALTVSLMLVSCAPPGTAEETPFSCSPMGYDHAQLLGLRADEFAFPNEDALPEFAAALTECLADPNPAIRDGVAYEALTTWMRGKTMDVETVKVIKPRLESMLLAEPGDPGYGPAFAALVLSEVARYDRIDPFMTDVERAEFVDLAAAYMVSIEDYRGFIDGEGWRHNVAHTADWLLQLSLNDNLGRDELARICLVITSQVKADGRHIYVHGEPARLARPILFIARRGEYTEDDWSKYFDHFADPFPMENWNQAFKSEDGLAHRHNVRAFLEAVYVGASQSQNETTRAVLPGVTAALRKVP